MYLLNITIRQEQKLEYWGRYILVTFLCNLRSVLQQNKLLLGECWVYLDQNEAPCILNDDFALGVPLSYQKPFSKVRKTKLRFFFVFLK